MLPLFVKEGAGGCSANNAGAIVEGCSVKPAKALPLPGTVQSRSQNAAAVHWGQRQSRLVGHTAFCRVCPGVFIHKLFELIASSIGHRQTRFVINLFHHGEIRLP